jgi:hypothetical protein
MIKLQRECLPIVRGKAADPFHSSAALQKLAHDDSFWSATAKLSLFTSARRSNPC